MSSKRIRQLAAAVSLLGLAACDDWTQAGPVTADSPISNATNTQPQSINSLPRGAASYGSPPNSVPISRLLRTYSTN